MQTSNRHLDWTIRVSALRLNLMALVSSNVSLEPYVGMVLEVRKVITMLEECGPWYIFTANQ